MSREPLHKIFGAQVYYGQRLKIQEGLTSEEQDAKTVRFKDKNDIPSVSVCFVSRVPIASVWELEGDSEHGIYVVGDRQVGAFQVVAGRL